MNYDTEIQIHKDAIGSKTKLQESLLEAVQILHDGFIVDEKIPKTLECKIYDDSKKGQGIYIVDYMNNKFEVSCFLDETFNVDDIVCVLVPDGDFAKTKIIIGSSDGSGEGANWVTQEQLNQAVTTLQTNFQAGVDAIGAACTRKGSPPASSSLEDTISAIDAIQTGGNYATLEVNADGTYVASEDPRGIDAYDIVIVSKDVGQPHTVVFLGPDGSVIKTQANVPYHGYATCTLLDGTLFNGLYFKGWNPHPSNIVRDTLCYPVYGDYQIQSGEIADDQETICVKNGADYPLGSFKSIVINNIPAPGSDYNKIYYDGNTYNRGREFPAISGIAIEMYKVAEGEDGTTSTQLSSAPIAPPAQGGGANQIIEGYGRNENICQDWGISVYRRYLNEYFINYLPLSIIAAIKPVNKAYMGQSNPLLQNSTPTQKTSLDKIQIPSLAEMNTLFHNATCYGLNYEDYKESTGIDYTRVYMPTFPGDPQGYIYQQGSQVRSIYPDTSSYQDTPETFGQFSYVEDNVTKWGYGNARTNSGFIGFCM